MKCKTYDFNVPCKSIFPWLKERRWRARLLGGGVSPDVFRLISTSKLAILDFTLGVGSVVIELSSEAFLISEYP